MSIFAFSSTIWNLASKRATLRLCAVRSSVCRNLGFSSFSGSSLRSDFDGVILNQINLIKNFYFFLLLSVKVYLVRIVFGKTFFIENVHRFVYERSKLVQFLFPSFEIVRKIFGVCLVYIIVHILVLF